jgi:hypothetical protein
MILTHRPGRCHVAVDHYHFETPRRGECRQRAAPPHLLCLLRTSHPPKTVPRTEPSFALLSQRVVGERLKKLISVVRLERLRESFGQLRHIPRSPGSHSSRAAKRRKLRKRHQSVAIGWRWPAAAGRLSGRCGPGRGGAGSRAGCHGPGRRCSGCVKACRSSSNQARYSLIAWDSGSLACRTLRTNFHKS